MLLQFRPIGTFKNNFALALMHLHCQFQSLELGNLSIDGSELLKIRKKWKKIPRAQLYKKYPWHYLTINLLHSYIQFVKKFILSFRPFAIPFEDHLNVTESVISGSLEILHQLT